MPMSVPSPPPQHGPGGLAPDPAEVRCGSLMRQLAASREARKKANAELMNSAQMAVDETPSKGYDISDHSSVEELATAEDSGVRDIPDPTMRITKRRDMIAESRDKRREGYAKLKRTAMSISAYTESGKLKLPDST